MSHIQLNEIDGQLALKLSKSDPSWSKLNDLVKSQTSGIWNERTNRWMIPRTDIKAVKKILNQMVDTDNDNDSDESSGEEGYATDTGETEDNTDPSNTITNENTESNDNKADDAQSSKDTDDADNDDVDDDDTDDVDSEDKDSDNDKINTGNGMDDDDNAFDCITDDARQAKIKKIMKHTPFQYYAKHNLSRNEFRCIMSLCN